MTPSKDQAKVAVRAVLENVKQVLSQPEIGPISEADTRANFIDKYVYNLGYDGIGVVVREYYVKDLKEFIDYLLRVDARTQVAIEAKSLRSELTDASAAQLVKYAAIEGVEWCVLTNGRELHIYNQYLKGGVQDKLVVKLDLLAYNSDTEFDAVFEQFWLLSRQSMAQAAITTLMEQVTLDRAIRQLMLDPKSATVRGIRSDLRSKFRLSPTSDQIMAWLKDRIIGRPQLSVVPPSHSSVPAVETIRESLRETESSRSRAALVAAHSQRLIVEMMNDGILAVGTRLTAHHRGREFRATVEPDGSINVDGERFTSLSAAAAKCTAGVSTNGWKFWHFNNQPMRVLRDAFLQGLSATGS